LIFPSHSLQFDSLHNAEFGNDIDDQFCFVDSFRERIAGEQKEKIEAVLLGVWQTRGIGRTTER
jgi:hypothetical protein